MTPAQATDERFWVTAGFSVGKEYSLARWPFAEVLDAETSDGNENSDSQESKRQKRIKENTSNAVNHWFCSNSRSRMRDHAISRLWWMAYIARRVNPAEPEKIYEG